MRALEWQRLNRHLRRAQRVLWLTFDAIARFVKRRPNHPDDPYALVGAPKEPRPPHRSAAAAEPLD